MRITNTKCRLYRNRSYTVVLVLQEKGKTDKYLCTCHKQPTNFTLLVYTVYGIAGRDAKAAEKKMALYIAAKWNNNYLVIVIYV